MTIPKIIHQTWKNENIPDNWKNGPKSFKYYNQAYEYKLWTDVEMEDFILINYKWFYDTYKSYKYDIQRCDAFRYFVLHTYGGFYSDLDIVCKKSLDEYLNYDLVLAKSSMTNTFTNSFFASTASHPFINFCINNLQKYSKIPLHFGKHMHVMYSTGPQFLSKNIKKYTIPENTYILNKEEFAGDCNVCNENTCTGGTTFKHIKGQSWNGPDSLFYNFIFCKRTLIIFLIVIFSLIFYLLKVPIKSRLR
jgi:inositol phosphorylceramide mannosyltransferase catalytic subunit